MDFQNGEQVLATVEIGMDTRQEVAAIIAKVDTLTITTAQDYQTAADIGRDIKTSMKAVETFFDPLIANAHATHKALCAKKNETLAPLERKEAELKRAMVAYQNEQARLQRLEQERIRKEAEEAEKARIAEALRLEEEARALEAEARRIAEEVAKVEHPAEAETLSQAAAQKVEESQSKAAASENAFSTAQMAHEMSQVSYAAPVSVKASGTAVKQVFEISVTDASKVPVSLNGVLFRPVDEAAILRFVKLTDGNTPVPGVVIRKTAAVSFKGR